MPRWPDAEPDLSTLGKRLQYARRCKRLEQGYVAKRFGLSKHTIIAWELGKRGVPLERISWFAKLYRVSPKWLLELEGPGPEVPRRLTEVERIMRCL